MLSKKIRAYKLAHPKAKAKEIASAVGCKPAYVYQVLHYKNKDTTENNSTEGQQTLRNEIIRLNADIDSWRSLYFENLDTVEQLQQDVVGYRAVISYLQGQLDGITV
jgi:peptidoglycan hydrolase CwlO-like protein